MLHLAALALLLAMRATPGRAASVECEQAFTGRGGLQPPRSVARTRALRALHAGFWQVRTKDFIMPSGDHNDWQAEAKRPFNVLLVGDSLDRELVVAACYGHPGEYLDRGALYCPDTHRWKNESFMCRSEK